MRQEPGPEQGPEPRRRRPGFLLRILLQLFDSIKDDLFLILAATLLVFATLLEAIVTTIYAKSDRLDRARRIDKWARVCFPGTFMLILVGSAVL